MTARPQLSWSNLAIATGLATVSRQPRLPQRQSWTRLHNGQVADIRGETARPKQKSPGRDNARPDSSRQPYVDHVVSVAAGAISVLGERSGVGVVDQLRGKTSAPFQLRTRADTGPARHNSVGPQRAVAPYR